MMDLAGRRILVHGGSLRSLRAGGFARADVQGIGVWSREVELLASLAVVTLHRSPRVGGVEVGDDEELGEEHALGGASARHEVA